MFIPQIKHIISNYVIIQLKCNGLTIFYKYGIFLIKFTITKSTQSQFRNNKIK